MSDRVVTVERDLVYESKRRGYQPTKPEPSNIKLPKGASPTVPAPSPSKGNGKNNDNK